MMRSHNIVDQHHKIEKTSSRCNQIHQEQLIICSNVDTQKRWDAVIISCVSGKFGNKNTVLNPCAYTDSVNHTDGCIVCILFI